MKQTLQVRYSQDKNYNNFVSPRNIGYKKVTTILEAKVKENMPAIMDSSINRHIKELLDDLLNGYHTIPSKSRKILADKMDSMTLDYLDNIPEKEKTKLILKYITCRK